MILNNLGGTSKLEELVVARELVTQLEARGCTVARLYAGHMMTSLEMAGILISLLKVIFSDFVLSDEVLKISS